MNSRYLLPPETLCNSGYGVLYSGEGNIAPNLHISPPQNSPPPFLIRLSRAKWYSFLRRVFHYQNGSGSDLGPNPFNSRNWMLMEFITLAIQISAIAYTLIMSKQERLVWPMRIWISGYAFGCFLTLILLYCRYTLVYLAPGDDTAVSDIEQQRSHQDSRSLQYMNKCKTSLDLLFAVWFVLGNIWIFDSGFGSYNRASKLYSLWIALLAWNAVCYSFPFILFVLLCCCVPLLSRLLGYNLNKASLDRGATEEQIAGLQSWKYKDVPKNNEIQECCICLAKYKDKEEIRKLPCTHIFHLKCVDQWLKIISCCPLCKQGIEK
ncbi:hypothetical protein ACJIZ3_012990 [Penstemon smallii]|uniref:RING-type domain-containing protein n=1 Tax=Penstemon smallii TaxID=265156 RepID=A0ABD3URG6_9LAMI